MQRELDANVALGALKLIALGAGTQDIGAFGANPEDYLVFRGENAWTRRDADRMGQVFKAVAQGAMEQAQLPLFQLSAEYVAAVIFTFVHPCNMMQACEAFHRVPTNDELARAQVTLGSELCTPGQLWACILKMAAKGDGAEYRRQFEENTHVLKGQVDATA